jgi:hypothetical protein
MKIPRERQDSVNHEVTASNRTLAAYRAAWVADDVRLQLSCSGTRQLTGGRVRNTLTHTHPHPHTHPHLHTPQPLFSDIVNFLRVDCLSISVAAFLHL